MKTKDKYFKVFNKCIRTGLNSKMLVIIKLSCHLHVIISKHKLKNNVVCSLGDFKVADVGPAPSVAGRAYDVEQCDCGQGYSGLSCEVSEF